MVLAWTESEWEILEECVRYFKRLFRSEGTRNHMAILECVPEVVATEMNQ